MSDNFKKQATKNDLYLLNKYLKKWEIKTNDKSIKKIYKTSKYTITIYNNNTLLIQGKDFHNILKMIDNQSSNIQEINDSQNLIGSDEVGTGDVFGGIVVAAAYIKDYEYLNSLKITDSKKYNNDEIKLLYEKIKNKIIYEVINIFPEQYNELYSKFNNLNILKTYGHNFCHQNLINKLVSNKINYESIVIDQFTPINLYKKYCKEANLNFIGKEICYTKAESKYLSVAAASIVARYYFLKQIDELKKQHNINIPLGAVNYVVQPIIKKLKESKYDLSKLCKLHFKSI